MVPKRVRAMNTSKSNSTPLVAQLFTVKQLAQKYPAFSEGSLRYLLFNRERNGLDRAVIQIGRRVLIDEQEFVAWLRQQKGGA